MAALALAAPAAVASLAPRDFISHPQTLEGCKILAVFYALEAQEA